MAATDPEPSQLFVAGSIALDTLEGPQGTVTDELGGSALYFSLAASLLLPVALSAPVGRDAAEAVETALRGREIDAGLVSVLDAPTYRWRAQQAHGRNVDLGSRDEIYDAWQPALPEDFTGWAFVGSMRPRLQAEIAQSLRSAGLLAADAMHSYVTSATLEVEEVLSHCDWYFANGEEFEVIAAGVDPALFRAQRSLEGLCIKSGPSGTTLYTEQGSLSKPALQGHPVVDPTGAGDALAGGFLARWLQLHRRHDALPEALAHGIACASIAIEDIGLRSLIRATRATVEERVRELVRLD